MGKKSDIRDSSAFWLILIYLLFLLIIRRYCACGNVINYLSNNMSEPNCNIACVGNPAVDSNCGSSAEISIYSTLNSLNIVSGKNFLYHLIMLTPLG